jgi:sugar/nucleoside kinase (ribokinase family)
MSVFVIGGTTFDLLLGRIPQLPTADPAGDEFTARSLAHLPAAPTPSVGGNAGNAAYALARLGCDVHLVTSLADDLFGRQLRRWLHEVGCHVTVLPPRETSINVVVTDASDSRVSYFRPVATDTSAAAAALRRWTPAAGDHVFITGYPHIADPVILGWLQRAADAGASTSMDIGPAIAAFGHDRLAAVLPLIDVLFGNRQELEGAGHLTSVRGEVVRKAGRDGASVDTAGGAVHVPALPVPMGVSSVGAGDVFDAAYLWALLFGRNLSERLRFAAAAAAIMLRRGRGVLGAASRAEVDSVLNAEQLPAHHHDRRTL